MSKHLGVLKHAGLVRDRREGRQTHYSAEPQGLAPLIDWMSLYGAFWRDRFDRLETLIERDGPMNETSTETLSLVVEREMPHPPEKIWRALTQPHLIEEWLMKNDFQPVVDHRFNLRADWGTVDCQVLAVEPNKTLSYTWAAYGLESVVTWTLTPTSTGTHLRMEQSGFRPDQQQAYQGAKAGWQKFFSALEQVLGRTD